MSRVINPDSAGKERTRLTKAIVITIRELAKQTEPNTEARDMASFIALALQTIAEGIDVSVAAWEKRNYWVKADRFRMDWDWTRRYGEAMRSAITTDDWAGVASSAAEIAMRVNNVKVPKRHKLGTPWVGAYAQLRSGE